MINFHKYAFLDTKRLKNYIKGTNHWLCQYSPVWLFIWSDFYKPEIAFTNDYVFIRFFLDSVGYVYYPPIGSGKLKDAYEKIVNDTTERGIELHIAPIEEEQLRLYEKLGLKSFECVDYNSYIYSSDALSFMKGKPYKDQRKLALKFEHTHPNAVYKKLKKEDFPLILEFITNWNTQNKDNYNTPYFYHQLNMVKKCMDHLYELDLLGVMLLDENGVYGVVISSIMDNVATIHVNLAMDSILGAHEELIQCFARTSMQHARYISFGEDGGVEITKKLFESYKPVKVEKYFSTMKIEGNKGF